MSIGNNQDSDLEENIEDSLNTEYSIGKIAKLTGIKPTVLRFWESEFSQLKPQKNNFGHRFYNKNDIELILIIKKLLYGEGLTIKGAKNVLNKNYQPKNFDVSSIRNQLEDILKIIRERNKK